MATQIIFDATTPETLRDEIVRYLLQNVKQLHTSLGAGRSISFTTLTDMAHEIAGARLHKNVVRKE